MVLKKNNIAHVAIFVYSGGVAMYWIWSSMNSVIEVVILIMCITVLYIAAVVMVILEVDLLAYVPCIMYVCRSNVSVGQTIHFLSQSSCIVLFFLWIGCLLLLLLLLLLFSFFSVSLYWCLLGAVLCCAVPFLFLFCWNRKNIVVGWGLFVLYCIVL